MSEDKVRFELRGAVAWITLDRPEARNAITPAMRDKLTTLFQEVSAAPDARAVVLTGAGQAFCAGADVRGGGSSGERRVGDVARTIRMGWQRLIASILDCEKPVVCALNGLAAGGGMQLALACDLVLASEKARLIQVFVRRGLVPDAGSAYLLARLVGPQRAKELMFFGDDVPAPEAERLGLVNRVVPAGELEKTAAEWAERLASGPTQALGLAKKLVNRSLESGRETAFDEEAWAQEINAATEDMKEGMRSFGERRPPRFEGR